MMSDNRQASSAAEALQKVTPVTPPPTLVVNRQAAATNAIKAHILKNGLLTGDPLPTEAMLSAELGVSRSSVREALRTLEALDIVEIRHGTGSFVGEMSLEPLVQTLVLRASLSEASDKVFLREVVQQRRWLDLGAAAEVVQTMHETPSPEARNLVERMEELADQGERFFDEDIAFHRILMGGLNNRLAQQTYDALWLVHMSIIPNLSASAVESLRKTAMTHRHMLDAAEAGDLAAYITAVDEHYAPVTEILQD